MNDIFNDNVPLKTETPAFAKHVLPAVPLSEVYLEDCVTALKRYADNYFDLAIVDPPYGLERFKANDGGNSKKITTFGDKDKNWNNIKPTAEYWAELFRVSKNQIVWGGNNFELPTSEYFIVWDKGQMMPSFARCEMAWTNCKVPAKIYAKRSQDLNRIHPTQKPTGLYDWILMNYAKEGYLILDTHLGSGSSRIAAYKGGFNFVGFEIDCDYFNAQEKRFNEFKSQLRLF
jgi:site-specific DNA-methyltransferase (adenine-specific)